MLSQTLQAILTSARWPWVALFASALMLAIAHIFEALGYAPCLLCLKQREVYWAIIAVSMLGILIQLLKPSDKIATAIVIVIGLAFLWEAGLAVYHAGVEWKFWPGPDTCAGGASRLKALDLDKALSGPQLVIRCDEASWRLLGLSMAGYNALISLGLAVLSFAAVRRTTIT